MSTTFLSIDLDDVNPIERHGYLLSAVAPRPIAFASTISKNGEVNLSPFSFFNVFSSNPPIMIFSPSRKGRENELKHSYLNVKEVPEVCINVVSYSMVEQMSLSSSNFDRGVNEFKKSGFTEVKSDTIKPPRVKEAPVSFECTVDQVIELGDQGGAGNLVICRVKRMHISKEFLDGNQKIDVTKLDLVGRMGGNWYSRTNPDAMFEVAKPASELGIGVDQLPDSIRNSSVLSGNDIGKLGSLPNLPESTKISVAREDPEILSILKASDKEESLLQIHQLAKNLINNGQLEKAALYLLIADIL